MIKWYSAWISVFIIVMVKVAYFHFNGGEFEEG